MLVLTRTPLQVVLIPELNIRITVVEVKPSGHVKLGFDAPRDITIVREEIYRPNHVKGNKHGNSKPNG